LDGKLEIIPLKKPVCASVRVPGSKSHTNRALIMAALTKGPVCLKNPLYCEDTEAMIGILRTLGLKMDLAPDQITLHGDIGSIEDKDYQLFAHDSGTTARFALALICLVPGVKTIQGSRRLNERPIRDLVEALRELGARIEYCGQEGQLPVKVVSSTLTGNVVHLKGDVSSQFYSALLLISPYLSKGLKIHIVGPLISKSYVEMTLSSMQEWAGVGQYTIEGDFSSAGYFFAIAALTKSMITVENLNSASKQPDRKFLGILEKMGNIVSYEKQGVRVVGKEVLPLDVDMEECPDQVMTLAVLAAFAKGVSKISGIRSLRVKETERVLALKNELGKMGIRTEDTHDTLTIYGGSPHAAEIDTYNDHRMAMAFAVAGIYLPGIVIRHPEVVNKSFPTFWEVLELLR
jgi:3-phosphoshikimate 1-carboxyvinyltransferase